MAYLDCYVPSVLVDLNRFRNTPPEQTDLPCYETSRPLLPQVHWPAHSTAIDCYWKAWELAFAHLRRPTPQNGFVANYIDTAFNDHLFLWDSVFILMFGRYGRAAFDFQRTLDNLYAKQHKDGFICRQIRESDGQDHFHRHDPSSTGPNVFAWSEWEYYRNFADRGRLERVFPVLVAYHRWLRSYRTWPDGTYWTNGWGCGMDNQPRQAPDQHPAFSHGWLSWIDACLQQILSARLLVSIGQELGQSDQVRDMRDEAQFLQQFINQNMWDERAGFYFDRRRDGSLGDVRTIGAYWALLAGAVPAERLERFLAPLSDPAQFAAPHRVPSLSRSDPAYDPAGGYWRGSVWPPTNYMVLRGLSEVGRDSLAHQIARNHLDNVVTVFQETGTIWENYAPESARPGKPARKDFVGWGGLGPIAVLLEYVIGLRPDARRGRLVWDIRLTEEHGVTRYPFASHGSVDLFCAARAGSTEAPRITARSTAPLTLEVRWDDGRQRREISLAADSTGSK